MIKIYEEELNELKERMEKAEKFAKKIPLFEDKIIKEKYIEEDECLNFGNRYKDLYLGWGIRRFHYISGTNCYVTNCEKEYDKYLFNIYINSLSVLGDGIYDNFDLEKIQDECEVFFYDALNNTYYVEDEHIEEFLEKLYEWYINAKSKVADYQKQQKIDELEKKLKLLRGE